MRRDLTRLKKDGIAREERLDRPVHREREGAVPGRDDSHNAERLIRDEKLFERAHQAADRTTFIRQRLWRLCRPVVDEIIAGDDLDGERFRARLARLGADGRDDLFLAAL